MKNINYIFLLLSIYSCKNASDNMTTQLPFSQENTIIVPSSNSFADHSLFSYNATAAEKFSDTLYALEIDDYLKKHPGDGTTQGDVASYYQVSQHLDTLIGNVYYEIYRQLKTEQDKKLFKIAQDKWKSYMESETKFLHQLYYTQKPGYGFGREHAITQAQWAFQVARQRLILLKNIKEQIYPGEAEE